MYFNLFKAQDWRKRSAEARRRNCAVLPKDNKNGRNHNKVISPVSCCIKKTTGNAGGSKKL